MNKRNDAPLYLIGGAITAITLAAFVGVAADADEVKHHDKTGAQYLAVGTPNIEDARDTFEVIPAPLPLVVEDAPVIQEDDPNWDCRFDGNEMCGVEIHGVWYVIQFRDGSPESVGYRGTGE